MKVFGCKCDMSYGGGLILVAANNVEEAYLTAAMDEKAGYDFDWTDDNGVWCEPDGNINHCMSDVYPKVIIEDSYYE